jgi:CRISPR-associated protein Cas2
MPSISGDTTFYLIAYDMSNDRRRTKVHRLLCGYGAWTQYSLFECWLTRSQMLELRMRLEALLKAEEDSVRIYALCGTCQNKVVTIGSPRPQEPTTFIV